MWGPFSLCRWLALRPFATAFCVVLAAVTLTTEQILTPIHLVWMVLDARIFTTILLALCGFQIVGWISMQLHQLDWLAHIGKNSKALMTHHLLGFALINLGFVLAGQLDPQGIGPYTIFIMQDNWWLYLAAGILVPMGISWCSGLVKARLLPELRPRR